MTAATSSARPRLHRMLASSWMVARPPPQICTALFLPPSPVPIPLPRVPITRGIVALRPLAPTVSSTEILYVIIPHPLHRVHPVVVEADPLAILTKIWASTLLRASHTPGRRPLVDNVSRQSNEDAMNLEMVMHASRMSSLFQIKRAARYPSSKEVQ
jgi:hypothetical protein